MLEHNLSDATIYFPARTGLLLMAELTDADASDSLSPMPGGRFEPGSACTVPTIRCDAPSHLQSYSLDSSSPPFSRLIDEMSEAMTREMDVATTTIGAMVERKDYTSFTPNDFALSSEQLEEFFSFTLPTPTSDVSFSSGAAGSRAIVPVRLNRDEQLRRQHSVSSTGPAAGARAFVMTADEEVLQRLLSVVATLQKDLKYRGGCCIPCAVLDVGSKPGGGRRRDRCSRHGCLRCGSLKHACATCPVKHIKATDQAKLCYFCGLPMRKDLRAHVRADGCVADLGNGCDSFARGVVLPIGFAIFNGEAALSESTCPVPPRARDDLVAFTQWAWSLCPGSSFCNSVHLVLWFVKTFKFA